MVTAVGVARNVRAFAASPARPRRSVLIASHTSVEMGDVASQWFTAHPTVSRDSIVGMINLDMIGRGGRDDEHNGGPNYLALVGTRRLLTELGDLVERVSQQGGFGWQFDYAYDARGHPEQIYCRSEAARVRSRTQRNACACFRRSQSCRGSGP